MFYLLEYTNTSWDVQTISTYNIQTVPSLPIQPLIWKWKKMEPILEI